MYHEPATVPVSQAFNSWGSPQYSEQNTAGRRNILHALEANVPTNGKDQMNKNKKQKQNSEMEFGCLTVEFPVCSPEQNPDT